MLGFGARHALVAARRRLSSDCRTLVTARRQTSSAGYYDSQSGQFVSTKPTVRIFEHDASSSAGAGAVHVVAPVDACTGRVARVASAACVATAQRHGASAGRFDCSVADRGEASAIVKAAAEHGLACDVAFADAASDIDPIDAELIVAELCDLGVRTLLFKVSNDDVDDDDDLRELLSVCSGVDVPGTPVRRRLGLSAAEDVDVNQLGALVPDVYQFDASATGRGHPQTAALLAALDF
jgi:hypothetical protein